MTDRRFIKPAEGMTVLDPDHANRPLAPAGRGVEWSSHWQRRLDEGEIEMTTEAEIAAAEKAAGKTPPKGDPK
jgi:hypothetical protein